MFNLIRDLNGLKHSESRINNKIVTRRENHTNENLFAKINLKKMYFQNQSIFDWIYLLIQYFKKIISDFDSLVKINRDCHWGMGF